MSPPRHLLLTLALYTAASPTHFVHNAEYIAYYPGMPAWITRETVYLAWPAAAFVGVMSAALWFLRRMCIPICC